MNWEFPAAPACSGPELLVHVDEAGEAFELPVPRGWTVEDIATTLFESGAL